MNKALLTAAGLAMLVVASLAGCSAEEHTLEETSAQATSPAAPKADDPLPTNECVDGQLTVTDIARAKQALTDGCGTISLLVDGADVTMGPVDVLAIEGSRNTVHGTTIKAVHALGTGNTVTYTGDAPDTSALGEGNTAVADTQ